MKYFILIMLMFLMISVFYVINYVDYVRFSPTVIITFILNSIVSLYMLFTSDKFDYSLNKMFWIFGLIFYSQIPFYQYIFNIEPWTFMSGGNRDSTYLFANIIIIMAFISYMVGRRLCKKVSYAENKPLYIKNFGIYVIFFVGVIVSLFYSYVFFNEADDGSRGSSLLLVHSLRAIAIVSISILIINYLENKNNKTLTLILLIVFGSSFITITGGQRYFLSMLIIGLFFTYKRNIGNNYSFIFFMIVGLIIYPIIGALRRVTEISVGISNNIAQMEILSVLSQGSFDAYSMLLNTIRYVEDLGITYGYQFIGALFFFVPRSLWPDKPIGSGAYVAEKLGFTFTNVSSPLTAEGYINFGLLGVIVLFVFLGFVIKKIDTKYWVYNLNNQQNFLYIIYPFTLALFFFIQRGDMMSGFAFFAGLLLSSFIYYKLIIFFFKKSNTKSTFIDLERKK